MGSVLMSPGGGIVTSDELTATAADVLSGKTFMGAGTNDEAGVGTLALTGTASDNDVLSGKTYYNTNAKSRRTGNLALTGSAQDTDVLSGKTYYNTNAQSRRSGTLSLTGNAQAGDVRTGRTFYNNDAKTKRTGTYYPKPAGSGRGYSVSGTGTVYIEDYISVDTMAITVIYDSALTLNRGSWRIVQQGNVGSTNARYATLIDDSAIIEVPYLTYNTTSTAYWNVIT